MKKIILKILDSIITLIEIFEDYNHWYHIDIQEWKKVISSLR